MKRRRYPLWVRLAFAVFIGWAAWGAWIGLPLLFLGAWTGLPIPSPLPLWVWLVVSILAFIWASSYRVPLSAQDARDDPDAPERRRR